MQVDNGEMVPLSSFRRDITSLIDELQSGKREKVVVTKHGKLEFVVLAVPRYEELEDG